MVVGILHNDLLKDGFSTSNYLYMWCILGSILYGNMLVYIESCLVLLNGVYQF